MMHISARTLEGLAWPVRALLGAAVGCVTVGLTYALHPLHQFPLLLAFPTVVLSGWFLGMSGSFGCALVDVVLIDVLMVRLDFHFSTGFVDETVRMGLFLVLSTLLGILGRMFANQRVALRSGELKERLLLAEAQQQVAEERARAAEALSASDELLQIALSTSGMGLWAWNAETGHVVQSNEVFHLIGRRREEMGVSPEDWIAIVHPEDRQELCQVMKDCKDLGGRVHHHYRILRPDGSVRWLEQQGHCQLNEEGQVKRMTGLVADVTHRRHTEELMLRAEKLAVAGRLAASVAHEINNPLEAVANLLYLVSLACSLDDARSYARTAMDELMRISLITQSTLKFHRQAGEPQVTRLSELLDGLVAMFRSRINSAGIELDLQVKKEIEIACMPGETQQIFANLISNSIEAMPRGGRLRVRLHPTLDWRDGATAGMRVTVFDSGEGMDRAIRERLFEPFFTTKTETGTGLGMWVVAQLVGRHGGDVHVWSSTRAGASCTAVSVFLPVEPVALQRRNSTLAASTAAEAGFPQA